MSVNVNGHRNGRLDKPLTLAEIVMVTFAWLVFGAFFFGIILAAVAGRL